VRDELAAGRPVDLVGDANVGLDVHPLPDRFAQLADTDGILRSGDIHIGLSDPLTLEVWMETKEGDTPTAAIALHRIPSEPGSSTSYGGAFHGALVFIDINPDAERPDGEAGKWADTSVAVWIDADGVPATELVTGLGFALAFGRADRLHLSCDGALPADGLHLDIADHGLDGETAKILEHAVIVTTALAQLTWLDGRPRSLTPTGAEHDIAIAELVLELLHHHEIRNPLTAPYRYSIPDDVFGDDAAKLMRGVRRPAGTLAGQPTVIVELRIDGDADGRLIEMDGKTLLEATPREGARAEIVMELVGRSPELDLYASDV